MISCPFETAPDQLTTKVPRALPFASVTVVGAPGTSCTWTVASPVVSRSGSPVWSPMR
ncbi:hypothetical protein ACFPRL_08850 [Pseudoclavibacter helvolus]